MDATGCSKVKAAPAQRSVKMGSAANAQPASLQWAVHARAKKERKQKAPAAKAQCNIVSITLKKKDLRVSTQVFFFFAKYALESGNGTYTTYTRGS